MTNLGEIEIATIKNLKAIFFYYIGDNPDKRILGLRIVYDNDKVLDYDYTYKYFKSYVAKVLEVYSKEKKDNNIVLYSELTEDIVKNINYEVASTSCNDNFDEYKINLYRVNNFGIKDIEDYLKNVILSIMEVITSNEESSIENIRGYRNKFIAEVKTTRGNMLVPFTCINKENNSYIFKMYFSDNSLFRTIEGNINIEGSKIEITWNNYDKSITGKYYYSLLSDIRVEFIQNKDNTLYYNDSFNNSSDDVVRYYASLVGITGDKIVSTIPNNYIVLDEDSKKSKDNVFYRRKTGYINIKEDYVSIIYFYVDGVMKYNGNLDVPFMCEEMVVRLIPFNIGEEHYILREVSVLPTFKMSGEYKNNINKYAYYVMKVNQNNDLRHPIVAYEEYKIDAKDIDNLTYVEKYVRERKK